MYIEAQIFRCHEVNENDQSAKSESLLKALFFLVLCKTLTGFLSQAHSIESRLVVRRTGKPSVCGLCVYRSARKLYGLGQ